MTVTEFRERAPEWLTTLYRSVAMGLLIFVASVVWQGLGELTKAIASIETRVAVLEKVVAEDHDTLVKGRQARFDYQSATDSRLSKIETTLEHVRADVSAVRRLVERRADTEGRRASYPPVPQAQ